MHCDLCGIEESMPFRCRYCKETFCSIHRLPPNHNCFFLQDYLEQPGKDREFLERIEGKAASPQVRIRSSLYETIFLRNSTGLGQNFVYCSTARWSRLFLLSHSFRLSS